MVNSKLRRHKVMERVIRKLMASNLPPSFKFKDTYDSIELPSGYTLPSQQNIEDEFDTLLAEENEIPKTSFLGDLEIGTSNLFVDTSVSSVGIGTDSPISRLDVSDLSNSNTTPILTLNHSGVFDFASPAPSVWRSIDFTTDYGTRTRQCGINLLNYSSAESGQNGIADRLRTGLGFSVHNENGMVENALVINKDGNVGVGTNSPAYKLDVNGTLHAGNSYFDNVGVGTNSPAYNLDVNGTLHAGNSYFDNIYIGGSTARGLRSVSGQYGTVQTTGEGASGWEGYSINGRYVFMSADDNKCGIYNDLDNEWMIYCYRNSYVKLYYNGGTKLETISGGVKIHGSLTATGNVTAYSDIRHKKDIVKLENALEKVEKLNGYTYARKDDDNRYTGLIAQEVLDVLPEAVNTDEKGEYAVAYGNMAGLFIEAFKELNSKLESAMTRIKELENTPK